MTSVLSSVFTPLKGVLCSSIVGTALAVFAFAAPAVASPINYSITGTGTGMLGGNSFSDDAVTISLLGDTSGIVMSGSNIVNPAGGASGTVTVDTMTGVLTATVPNIQAYTTAFSASGGVAGFMSTSGSSSPFSPANIWATSSSAFGTGLYGLGFIDPTQGTSIVTAALTLRRERA